MYPHEYKDVSRFVKKFCEEEKQSKRCNGKCKSCVIAAAYQRMVPSTK